MDKRKEKTIRLVEDSLIDLVKVKDYNDITTNDIIEKASICRATFYNNFNNKDDVLHMISNDIFLHVSSVHLEKETHHDFSRQNDVKHRINHMLCHFYEDKDMLNAFLSSSAKDILISDLKKHINNLVISYLYIKEDNIIPKDLLINHLTVTLVEITRWWLIENNATIGTNDLTNYYFKLIEHLL